MKRPQRRCPWGCGKLVAVTTTGVRYRHTIAPGFPCHGSHKQVRNVITERARGGMHCVCDICADERLFPYVDGYRGSDEWADWWHTHSHHPMKAAS